MAEPESRPTKAAATSSTAKKATAGVKKAAATAKKAVETKQSPKKVSAAKKATAKASGPRVSPLADNVVIDANLSPSWSQQGDVLTTAFGTPVESTDNTLRAGARGPALLEDFHLREKIMHFDHERIPERVVHARGAGAHGHFRLYESLADITCARFLCDTEAETPMFVRFSTVAGSRGSADTARDVRGFAAKFYTSEGNFDLVGNNIPVFFIQDGIKFPDIIHAAKPEPDREIPQAQTAHDTFWDFVSLTPESTHMLMWVMSDRAIPRSYRMMEGFGVHTFRLVNARGATTLVKFHWKPVLGVHGLVWEESQKLGGIDPDFHRRDLWNAIETGGFPEWELGLQLLPDTEDQFFEGIDVLDPTKIVPEEIAPVVPVGRMTLDRNPTNFFAETEQVAFHTGHLVRGIDITDDPLLHARMFSYLDTQLTRLGGPNFEQLPINRPHADVNDNHRDGFGQQAIPEGRAPYSPNSIGGGCPFAAGDGGYVHVPRAVDGPKIRERPQSFDDHYTQATLFWNSMTEPERDHIVGAFSFELGKVASAEVVERTLSNLANVDPELVEKVAAHLGVPAPTGSPAVDAGSSPALSMAPTEPAPLDGRLIGLVAGEALDPVAFADLDGALTAEGAVLQVIASHGGTLTSSVPVQRTFHTCESVEFDAIVVAGGLDAGELAAIPKAGTFLQEAYRHHKTIATWGSGAETLAGYGIPADASGVVAVAESGSGLATALIAAMGQHRHWDRR